MSGAGDERDDPSAPSLVQEPRSCMAQHGTARHGMALHGIAQHGTARHGTARHSPAQRGTAQPLHSRTLHGFFFPKQPSEETSAVPPPCTRAEDQNKELLSFY